MGNERSQIREERAKRQFKKTSKMFKHQLNYRPRMHRLYAMRVFLVLVLASACVSELVSTPKAEIKTVSSSRAPSSTAFIRTAKPSLKPLVSTEATTIASSTTKESFKSTKAYVASESPATLRSTTRAYMSTRGVVKSARKVKMNVGGHSPRLQERLGAVECDVPELPRESRLWRGNETHELNLPVTECAGSAGGEAAGAAEECAPLVVSWEGAADIQSGDILIVRIADAALQPHRNDTTPHNVNVTDREHHAGAQPAVYQVTRQGHEHCDVSDGMLLDITPLDEQGSKIFTLYDKDLSEGINLLIVVSSTWVPQCVRLKVTVKSDNCGEAQDCSAKGVCYTNVSMEGYECQCCGGFVGPHCEERDACNPSPCLNNGVCVDLTQPLSDPNYHCLCPYGFGGRNCEKDPCETSPCLNGGSCMSMAVNSTTAFHCACADGWTGQHCELAIAGGACASNPCVNGICVDQTDDDVKGEEYRCFCQPGYTGDRCELEYNECVSSPCANGGTCTDRVGGFVCTCGRGYTGNTCQLKVDLCSPNPCPSHRYCVDRGNNYACECPRGYVGDECHIPARSACDNNPCAHGGTCWSGIDSFYCSCRPGYTGKLCEEDFILESVVGPENGVEAETRGGGSVREVRMPLGLYHDRLHNVYIAAGTLGAAIAIVGVVVTACHCRVNKTYARLLSRLHRPAEPGPPHHWLDDKRYPTPFPPASSLDTDMYYTLDFSESQSSPLIQ